MKFLFELTYEEQMKICDNHKLTPYCGTCPLMIDGDICTLDISDRNTPLKDTVTKLLDIALKEIDINDYIRMDKTKVGEQGESGERK